MLNWLRKRKQRKLEEKYLSGLVNAISVARTCASASKKYTNTPEEFVSMYLEFMRSKNDR